MIPDIVGKRVRAIGGLRTGRDGVVLEVKHLEGGGGLHVRVRFDNGAEHWHHVATVQVSPDTKEGARG